MQGYEADLRRVQLCIEVFAAQENTGRSAAELAEAQEAARRLAAEVERLATVCRGAGVNAAFVETARVVLSEVTFQRIMERARDRAVAAETT